MAAGDLRYHCPVWGCRWIYDEELGMPGELFDPRAYGRQVVRMPNPAALTVKTERELETHLRTHTTLDYLQTISKLRNKIAELEGRAVGL